MKSNLSVAVVLVLGLLVALPGVAAAGKAKTAKRFAPLKPAEFRKAKAKKGRSVRRVLLRRPARRVRRGSRLVRGKITRLTGIKVRPVSLVATLARRTLNCTTAGDSMGGLEVRYLGRAGFALKEKTMGDKVYEFTSRADGGTINDYVNGRRVGIAGRSATTNEFGGAISDAALLALGPMASGQRTGFYARGGIVFMVTCKYQAPVSGAAGSSPK